MTDEPTPDPAPSDPPGLMGDAASEEELDALLAEAATLSDAVVGEVGAPADQDAPAGQDASTSAEPMRDEHPDPAAEVDTELAELEHLLDETGREISGASTASDETRSQVSETEPPSGHEVDQRLADAAIAADVTTEPGQPEGDAETGGKTESRPVSSGEDLSVPDFMSEFTDAEPKQGSNAASEGKTAQSPPAERSNAGTAASATAPPNGGSGAAGRADDPEARRDSVDVACAAEQEPCTGSDEEESAASSPHGTNDATPGVCRRAVAGIAPLALPLCERGVRLLETLDRPTRRLADAPRRFIGWLAIATIGTSVIVYLTSMF